MRYFVLALLLTAWLTSPAPAVNTIPAPNVPDGLPFTLKTIKNQHRFLESQTKSRLLAMMEVQDSERTANQERYDVTFYDLELELIPSTEQLLGTTTITATVLDGPLSTMELNLHHNMTVSGTTSGGVATTNNHSGESIVTVDLDREYAVGEEVVVTVTYAGNPESNAFGWDSFDGSPLIWTLSEPYGARRWWPCKDLNSDKADGIDLHVTVPAQLTVASNGLLMAETVPEPGKRTYHWESRYPIPTYLVSLAIHPYAQFSHEYTGLDGVTTMPVIHYVIPEYQGNATSGYAPTVSMLEAFAAAFGEYPFIEEKYGHAHFPWGGGMEHQTLSSMTYNSYGQYLVAHELAHQWWGDMITCADFSHIWLNEGFATWCEAYWREVSEGVAAYREEMADAAYYGDGTVFVEPPYNFNTIFDYGLTYQKASWVVHMLRGVLGDEDFFAGLRLYRENYAYSSATTEQFQEMMEQASGKDLETFINQWIYGAGYPEYRINWTTYQNDEGHHIQVRIEQTQPGQVFDMPLQIRLHSMFGNQIRTVQNDERIQYYHFRVNGQISDVVVDPNDWVLCQKTFGGTSDAASELPSQARLLANVPNPFNPSTEIHFELPAASRVDLGVYDASGRLVRHLLSETRDAGPHSVRWDGRDAGGRAQSSGIYFVRLNTGAGSMALRKITLVQ